MFEKGYKKKCPKCGKLKPISKFYVKIERKCKQCYSEERLDYYYKKKEEQDVRSN